MAVPNIFSYFLIIRIPLFVTLASICRVGVGDIMVGIVEVLLGITCHYINMAFD